MYKDQKDHGKSEKSEQLLQNDIMIEYKCINSYNNTNYIVFCAQGSDRVHRNISLSQVPGKGDKESA